MTQSDSLSLPAAQPTSTGIIGRISLRFGGTKAKELERFLKFCVVGTLGLVIDLSVTNILLKFVFQVEAGDQSNLNIFIANGIGFTAAVISNFIWNRFWTYPESKDRPIAPQLVQFFIVNIFGLLIREVIVELLHGPLASLVLKVLGASATPSLIAQLGTNMAIMVAVVVVMMWNFFVNRYWTYRDVK